MNNLIQRLETKRDKIYDIACEPYTLNPDQYNGCEKCKKKHGNLLICPKEHADKLDLALKILNSDFRISKQIIKSLEESGL